MFENFISDLDDFCEYAYQREKYIRQYHQKDMRLIKIIDSLFYKICTHLDECKVDAVVIGTIYRSHSSFRAAARLAFSTQFRETYPILRLSLESAGYGLLLFKNAKGLDDFKKRQYNKEVRKQLKNSITHTKVKNIIKDADTGLGELYSVLYEHLIDLGAHPNIDSLTPTHEYMIDQKRKIQKFAYLDEYDSDRQKTCFRFLEDVGLCALSIFQKCFPEHFFNLGISFFLEKHQEYIQGEIQDLVEILELDWETHTLNQNPNVQFV